MSGGMIINTKFKLTERIPVGPGREPGPNNLTVWVLLLIIVGGLLYWTLGCSSPAKLRLLRYEHKDCVVTDDEEIICASPMDAEKPKPVWPK